MLYEHLRPKIVLKKNHRKYENVFYNRRLSVSARVRTRVAHVKFKNTVDTEDLMLLGSTDLFSEQKRARWTKNGR